MVGEKNNKYTGFIYRTINLTNDKWYVGSCWCKNQDRASYFGSGVLLTRAIKKYGRENFNREILYYYFDDNPYGLKELETSFLERLDAANDPNSYNLKNYGYGLPWGENKNAPKEVREKWSKNNYWRSHIPPHMDALQKGREAFQKSEKGKAFAKKNAIHLLNFQKSPQWQAHLERFIKFANQPNTKEHNQNISRGLTGHKKSNSHIENHRKSLIEGGKVKGILNPRARECMRLDTLETFGSVADLVENLNNDSGLELKATLGGVWDTLERTENGGFYKEQVWLCFTAKKKSKDFKLQTKERLLKRKKVLRMIQRGMRNFEIKKN